MAQQSHVLIDADESIVADGATIRGGGASGKPAWEVRLKTLRGGRSEGVQIVEINNGTLAIDVLPTRGMGIWRVRRGKHTLGWQSPARGPVHPAFVPLMEPSGLGWLDGFDELLARCGLAGNGPPEFDDAGRLVRPLHGLISNQPARRVELIVDEAAGTLTVRGVVEESRFFFQSLRLTTSITTAIGSNEFSWTDEVENFSARDAVMQMLYHFNIGLPLLRPGARITAPVGIVAPKTKVAAEEGVDNWHVFPPPRSDSSEQVYCFNLLTDDAGETRVLISGLTDEQAIGMRWNTRTIPCFTVWRNTPAEADGYVLGIEPATNFPNPRAFEQQHDRVVKLAPGERWNSGAVTVAWHADAAAAAKEETTIRAIQGDQPTKLHTSPREDWSG